ncbi:MAG: putative sugar nucleotidyl transferase [Pirellulales bacterium]
MLTIVFEDDAADTLGVLAAARPICDLTIGTLSLVEALSRFGTVRRALRPHLASYLAALDGRRIAVWGGHTDTGTVPPPASRHGEVVLAVNARVVPDRDNLATLRSLVDAGRRCVVRSGVRIAAAVLHRDSDPVDHDRLPADGPAACQILDSLQLPEADAALHMLNEPHDVVSAHEQALAGSLSMRIDSGHFREVVPGLFAAETSRIADQVVVRQGPVVVADGAEIGPFVCLDGPLWIGPGARVNPHAWIRALTAIGRECRVGGEVEATVMEPFSNKPHDGFLGHSHVGSWVNLAAGTITSNLKATYGPVRLHGLGPNGSRLTIHTGRQFLGAMIGDFVKSGINSSIPCGARIGMAATVGGTVPEQVVAFANQLIGGEAGTRSTPAQVATVLERMMARRGLSLLDADRGLLEALA